MVYGDIYNIEERLQEHDPDLSLLLNQENGNYKVLYKNQYVTEWPFPLDDRLIKHMQKIDSHRGYDGFNCTIRTSFRGVHCCLHKPFRDCSWSTTISQNISFPPCISSWR